jgi:NDP-sugar pyrophosphorylase family protein
MSLAAFLLCAGYGERLRPLTDRIAKPAIPFLGRSALERNQLSVSPLNPERWLMNTHHLPEQMDLLARQLGLEVLHEPEILGTGGCIANAASVLEDYDHFVVHNADLVHSFDLKSLWESHFASGALATLIAVHHPRHNTLSVATGGVLLGVHGYRGYAPPTESSESARLTFAGVAFYQKEFLNFLEPGCEDVKRYWTRALEAGARIQVMDCSSAAWHDFGTPQGLWEASRFVMETAGEFNYRYPAANGLHAYVSNEAGEEGLPIDLKNVLLYEKPGTPVAQGTRNCILGKDFQWDISAG